MAIIATSTFESDTVGSAASNPPIYQDGATDHIVRSTIWTPGGVKYLEYSIDAEQSNAGSEWKPGTISPANPYSFTNGNTYYFAWYQRFNRIDGADIWDTVSGDIQSGDKGVEVYGTSAGIRWTVSQGTWDGFDAIGAGKWTVWIGNPTYHLNNGDGG